LALRPNICSGSARLQPDCNPSCLTSTDQRRNLLVQRTRTIEQPSSRSYTLRVKRCSWWASAPPSR